MSAYTYDDMDWLFTNLGSVIDKRKSMSVEAKRTGAMDKYNKPVDLLQILLDAEVGSGLSRGTSVSHLTMQKSEEDVNSNYDFSSELNSLSASSYLTSRLECHQQKHVETIGQQYQEKWSCQPNASCEKPKTRLSLDVSYISMCVSIFAIYFLYHGQGNVSSKYYLGGIVKQCFYVKHAISNFFL